jgi:hypothetical protein
MSASLSLAPWPICRASRRAALLVATLSLLLAAFAAAAQPLAPGATLRSPDLALALAPDSAPAWLRRGPQGLRIEGQGRLEVTQLEAFDHVELAAAEIVLRDRADRPLRFRSHGHLRLEADLIDIAALAHADSWVEAAGDLSLVSARPIRGDAHFRAGGNIRFVTPEGAPQSLESPLDPILLALGNVSLFNYVGASLHILAGGSITISDEVRITAVETDPLHAIHRGNGALFNASEPISSLADVMLSDGRELEVDGHTRPTIDLRAGIDWRNFDGGEPVPGWIGAGPPVILDPDPPEHAHIEVGSLTIDSGLGGGMILLTNRYRAAPGRIGDIIVGDIQGTAQGEDLDGTEVFIDSSRLVSTGTILTRAVADTLAGRGGEARLLAEGPLFAGDIDSAGTVADGGHHQGAGSITLLSRQQSIIVGALQSGFEIDDRAIFTGPAGDITLRAPNGQIELPARRVFSANVNSFSDPAVIAGGAGDIVIEAGRRLIGLEIELLAQADAPEGSLAGPGGRVEVSVGEGDVDLLRVRGFGRAATGTVLGSGGVRLEAADGAVRVGDTVGSIWTWTTALDGAATGTAGGIEILAGGDIEIASQLSSRVLQLGSGSAGNGGDIRVRSEGGSIHIGGLVDSWVSGASDAGNGGRVEIEAPLGEVNVGVHIITLAGALQPGSAAGRGGDIVVVAAANATLPALITGRDGSPYGFGMSLAGGGDVRVTSALGDILFLPGADIVTGFPFGSARMNLGPAGDVELLATQGRVQLGGSITAANEASSIDPPAFLVERAGAIRIHARDGVTGPAGASLLAYVFAGWEVGGRAGNIEVITETGSLSFQRVETWARSALGSVPGNGSILLRTEAGGISLAQVLRNDAFAPAGQIVADGGDIVLEASGAISVNGGVSNQLAAFGPVGRSGEVRLLSSAGSVSAGWTRTDLASNTSTGAAGRVVVEALGGGVLLADLSTEATALSPGTQVGRGGDIRLRAAGPIQAGTLRSAGLLLQNVTHAGSGHIDIESSQGDIQFGSLQTDFFAPVGSLTGPAGDIRVVAGDGRIVTASDLISARNRAAEPGVEVGPGGSIHLEAAQGLQWPAGMRLFSSSDAPGGTASGPGGDIRVIAGTGDIRLRFAHSFVRSALSGVQAGGDIELLAPQGEIVVSESVSAFAEAFGTIVGTSGAVSASAGQTVQMDTLRNATLSTGPGSSAGDSGAIHLASTGGSVLVGGIDNTALGDLQSGAAGGVRLEAPGGNVFLARAIDTGTGARAADGSAGRGGDVVIGAQGDVVLRRVQTSLISGMGATLGAGASHAGGGAIDVQAQGSVTLLEPLNSGFGAHLLPSPPQPWHTGPAGDVKVWSLPGTLAMQGDIFAANVNLDAAPNPSQVGAGGKVSLRAAQGSFGDGARSISTEAFSLGGLQGGGGDVLIDLGQGDIRLSQVTSQTRADTGPGWPSGAIDLVTGLGEIHIGHPHMAVTAAVRSRSGPGAASAAVRLQASGDVWAGALQNFSIAEGTGAHAGATGLLSLRSETGNVEVGVISGGSTASSGNAGAVTGLRIEAPQGAILTSHITLDSRSIASGAGDAVGELRLLAQGDISIGEIHAESLAGTDGQGTNAAAAIEIRSAVGNVSTAGISANSRQDGVPTGPAGDIEIEGGEVNIAGAVLSRGQNGTGSIRIVHGGNGVVPFTVGSLPNGSTGGLFTSEAALAPPQSFLYSHHEPPNIWIVSVDAPQYPVGGSVSGLAGTGLVLRNNGGDDLAITGNGTFEFATPVSEGGSYLVSVHAQPVDPAQFCSVANEAGTVSGGPVTDVLVTCVEAYRIGGSVSGLQGSGLVLLNNGGDALPISANGGFVFATAVAPGAPYAVTVGNPPVGQSCSVDNGSGTANADVLDVQVTCVTDPGVDTHPVGGTVTGLQGSGLVLHNNGGDALLVGSNGAFQFATALTEGSDYLVSIAQQPVGQTCAVSEGSGTVTGPVTDVLVSCATDPGVDTFPIGGSVSGLEGTGLVLSNNGGDALPVLADGAFVFALALTEGSAYNVQVLAQPAGQSCGASQNTGIVSGPVADVLITCATDPGVDTHAVGGTLSGLQGTGLVLTNNGVDALALAGDGPFEFAQRWTAGSAYLVEVATQPVGQTCQVANGSGTLTGDVADVEVNCSTDPGVDTFSVGGSVSGLAGTLVLSNLDSETLTITSDGDFAFATAWTDGSSYAVAIVSQPANQSCSLANGSGVIAGADVTDIAVTCISDTVTVTPIAGPGGSLDPGTPQQVAVGQSVVFAVSADPGYQTGAVGGTCGGTLENGSYTTAPVTLDCTVEASFIPLTTSTLAAAPATVRLGQPVAFTTEVTGTAAAPSGGQVTVSASTGESCSAAAPTSTSGNTHSYVCSIAFASLGPRQASASFAGSSSHAGSDSGAVEVRAMRFADVSVSVDDGIDEVEPGQAVDYLIELRNAGPDDAPGTLLVSAALPALADAAWSCAAVGAAVCPAPSGTGELSLLVDLPAGSGLDFVFGGTLPASLPSQSILEVAAAVDGDAPHFVHDPAPGNNQDADVNLTPGIFRDGFEASGGP